MTIRELGAILFVGAHPDDEIWLAAGILAAAVRNGQRVMCLTATRGEEGLQDEVSWPRERISEIRTKELEDSLEVIGVRQHEWLRYPDGRCDQVDEEEAAAAVRRVIARFKPDSILTMGPDGYTGHPDHIAVGRWTGLAAAGMDVKVYWAAVERQVYAQLRKADEVANIFFKVDQPRLVDEKELAIDSRLPEDLTLLKRQAFEKVPSQFERVLAARPLDRPGEALARECFVEAKG